MKVAYELCSKVWDSLIEPNGQRFNMLVNESQMLPLLILLDLSYA